MDRYYWNRGEPVYLLVPDMDLVQCWLPRPPPPPKSLHTQCHPSHGIPDRLQDTARHQFFPRRAQVRLLNPNERKRTTDGGDPLTVGIHVLRTLLAVACRRSQDVVVLIARPTGRVRHDMTDLHCTPKAKRTDTTNRALRTGTSTSHSKEPHLH